MLVKKDSSGAPIYISLIFSLFWCASSIAEITTEDYSILSIVLNHGFGDSCQKIAIEERTSAGSVALSSEKRPLAEVAEMLGIEQRMLTAWENVNLDFDYFADRFELSCDYQILSALKLAEIFNNTEDNSPETGWRNFRKALPDLVGIMRLGKPVIDHQSNSALAYVEFDCGPTCGSGRFVSLSKNTDNRWQVSGGSLVWMASE